MASASSFTTFCSPLGLVFSLTPAQTSLFFYRSNSSVSIVTTMSSRRLMPPIAVPHP